MKKRIFAFLLLLLVFFLGIWCFPRRVKAPTVAASFLGFTNSGGPRVALLALSNPPPALVGLFSVRRFSSLSNNVSSQEAGRFDWGRKEPWGMLEAISVDTTNEPLQVVFRFQQRAVGPRRIVEQFRELWGKVTRNEREFFTGNIFFITNEIRTEGTLR